LEDLWRGQGSRPSPFRWKMEGLGRKAGQR
jgi:hypothetical protein